MKKIYYAKRGEGKVSNKDMSKKKSLKYGIKNNNNRRIFFCIITVLFIFLVSSILPKSAKANSELNNIDYFYLNVIEDTSSAINYFSKENESTINKDFSINPFNLDNKDVIDSETKVDDSNEVANLYNPALKGVLDKSRPRVLIYHSHTCEAYATSDKDTSKTNSSRDQSRNVCAVGDVIADELEKSYGISVIHDKNVNDKPNYTIAYENSGVTLDKYLKKYGDFDLIIDLHRDSVDNKNDVMTKINGQDVAKFMFVVTQKNPRYAKQKKLVDSMIGTTNKLFPGLIRGTPIEYHDYGINFYNQAKSNNAVLIEVGTYTNTVAEVKNTGKYISRIIAEQLKGKK